MTPKYKYGDKVHYLDGDGEVYSGWVEDVYEELDPDNDEIITGYNYVFKRGDDKFFKIVNERRILKKGDIEKVVSGLFDI